MILTIQAQRAAKWVSEHRGELSRIARGVRPQVTPQFVHQVLRGLRRSEDGRVERALKKMGAPVGGGTGRQGWGLGEGGKV